MIGVIHSGAVWNRTPMYGTRGIRMPNPSMSITLTRNSDPSGLFKVGSVLRNESGDVDPGLRCGGGAIAHPGHDQIRNAAVVPVCHGMGAPPATAAAVTRGPACAQDC